MPEDFGGVGRTDVMPLQKDHDVFDFLLLRPGLPDPFNPHGADAGHAGELLRPLLDDRQRVGSEFLHNALRVLRPDALHQPGAKIFLHSVRGGGQRFLKGLDRELPAVSGVLPPCSRQRQHRADVNLRHRAHRGDQIAEAFRGASDDGITVLLVPERNPLNHAAQLFHRPPPFLRDRRQEMVRLLHFLYTPQCISFPRLLSSLRQIMSGGFREDGRRQLPPSPAAFWDLLSRSSL